MHHEVRKKRRLFSVSMPTHLYFCSPRQYTYFFIYNAFVSGLISNGEVRFSSPLNALLIGLNPKPGLDTPKSS